MTRLSSLVKTLGLDFSQEGDLVQQNFLPRQGKTKYGWLFLCIRTESYASLRSIRVKKQPADTVCLISGHPSILNFSSGMNSFKRFRLMTGRRVADPFL